MVKKKKIEYKWVILVLCSMMNFVCLGFCSSNKGMYLSAITEALDIPSGLFSINDSCRFIASALVNLFFGTLIVKVGVRKMTAIGFAADIAAMLCYAFADNIWMFYLGGTLLGVGLAFTTTSMTSNIVRRWFHKDIGKYTGIVLASNGIGGALASQIAGPMIESSVFGYRKSYLLVVGIVTVIGILVVALLREKPKEEMPVEPSVSKKKRGIDWYGLDFGSARRKAYFYMAAAVVLLFGICLQGANSAYIKHLKEVGMSAEFRTMIQSLFLLLLTGSKLVVGWIYDRFGLRVVMLICPIAAVFAFLVLILVAGNTVTAMVLAVVFCLLYALALPLETLVVPLIVNDLFGSVSYGKMLGIFSAINYAGYALGSPIINASFDLLDSYKYAFGVCGVVMVCGCVVFGFVLKEANKVRRQQAEMIK